jgi:uncharacterized protein YndB with AHSA1/START domain
MAVMIALAISVRASPDQLFAALTESNGLASFWTSDSEAEPVVGSVARFGFPSGSHLELRVDALDPAHHVEWTLLNDVLKGPHWTGTTVTWDLGNTDSGTTEVLFQQRNWPEEMSQADLAGLTYAWAQVLRALKAYVETGTPQPHFATAARELAETEAPVS